MWQSKPPDRRRQAKEDREMLTVSEEVENKIREEELAETGGIGETDLPEDKDVTALFEELHGPGGDPGEDEQNQDDLDENEDDLDDGDLDEEEEDEEEEDED